jgi:predicted secreted protein
VRNLLSIAALACALAASAPTGVQAQAEFTDQQLEAFVVAALAVDELIREWNPRIQGAENAEQAARLAEQANAELVETVARTEGITVEEYQEIGQAAQDDPALAARINDIYEQKTGD